MAFVALKHLHHESFAAILDTLFKEGLNLLSRLAIRRLGKAEFSWNNLEVLPQQFSTLDQRLWQQ